MMVRIAALGCVAAALYVATPVPPAFADAVVNIKLQDTTTNSAMKDMEMVLDRDTVPAGKVTLRATNESKQLIHEVLVFHDTGEAMPYNEASGKLVEKQMKSLGEVSDLKPGASGEKTFSLTPGTYLLICNQPMHLKSGMYARLKVVAGAADAPAAASTSGAAKTPPVTKAVAPNPKAKASDDDDAS
jgi:uncharacterized cupredoxin-like copper-binding protein